MTSLTPYAPLVLAVALVVALVLWVRGGRTWRALVAASLVVSWGFVIAATITPSPYAPFDPHMTCHFEFAIGRVPKERLANVLLFIPVGFVSWFASPRWVWIGIALAAPFLIEAAQGVIVALNRGCDVMDVVTNVLGTLVGVGFAAVTHRVWTRGPVR